MAEDLVRYDVADGVALLTLNRPERMNAWTGALATAYFDAIDRAGNDAEVRAVVVTGAGRGFCPGADMDLLQGRTENSGELAPGSPAADPRDVTHPTTLPKPLVAAINGACAGVGLVQALQCDLRFAATGIKMATSFSRRGLIAEYGSSWLLPRIVGWSTALDLLMSGRTITAEEALSLRLVDRVYPKDELVDAALGYAKDLAAHCSPASMAMIKKQLYGHATVDLPTALADSNHLMGQSLGNPDFVEGVSSYVDKRPPSFPPLGKGTVFDVPDGLRG